MRLTPWTAIEPFLDGVAKDLGRSVDPDAAAVAFVLDAADDSDTVDVPLDVVAAERLARPERRLDVDARAADEAAERGARERLGHRVEREASRAHRDDGQADAVDRHRVAERGQRCGLRRLDLEPDAVARPADRRRNANLPDDAREHGSKATEAPSRRHAARPTPNRAHTRTVRTPPTRGLVPPKTLAGQV